MSKAALNEILKDRVALIREASDALESESVQIANLLADDEWDHEALDDRLEGAMRAVLSMREDLAEIGGAYSGYRAALEPEDA